MAGLLGSGIVIRDARMVGGDAVSAELRLWAQTAFAWGTNDCLISVVRYVCGVLSRPMPAWPKYSTGAGALRILDRHGGLARYAAGVMAGLDCTVTRWPERGDVGLIDIPGTGPTMCLCLGRKWAARAQAGDGVIVAEMEPEIAWAVERERRVAAAEIDRRPRCLLQ